MIGSREEEHQIGVPGVIACESWQVRSVKGEVLSPSVLVTEEAPRGVAIEAPMREAAAFMVLKCMVKIFVMKCLVCSSGRCF